MNVLICGATSFVGKGFSQKLIDIGHNVDCFSRGIAPERHGNIVKGKYLEIDSNEFLQPSYDVVVNFALIKDGTIEDNISYIKALMRMCEAHSVKKLIHFSSVMVYPPDSKVIDENSDCDTMENTKLEGYGKIKIAVDQFLSEEKSKFSFETIFVRPGYVMADGVGCPYLIKLMPHVFLLKGGKDSVLPLVQRQDIHAALIKIIEIADNLPVYHLFSTKCRTKYEYAKHTCDGVVIPLPKWLFLGLPRVLMSMRIISPYLFRRIEGLFSTVEYNSEITSQKLNVNFN